MKKIFLNETHIRQLVKETLENLLIDNEVNHNLSSQEVVELINNSELKYNDLDVDGSYGYIKLIYTNPRYEEIDLEINFQIMGHVSPYYHGDYYTQPEGGNLEIQEIKPISAIIYLNGEEYELNMKELYKFLSDKLDSYWNEIYEKVDPEYFTNEPDPDAKYDARKNGDFN